VEEARGELHRELGDLVREARALIGRERSRGRLTPRVSAAVKQAVETNDAVAAKAPADSTAAAAGTLPAPAPPAAPFREPAGSRTLALPGFEEFASNAPVLGHAEIPAATPLAPRPDLALDLPALAREVAACRRCTLCGTRTQTVFADGSPSARLLFVGEAPGKDEDAQGLPFVGRAGQLLNKMIAAIELRREEVYICNVLKCRPPDNRVPAPDEVEQCLPFLEQQIALVKPALICALGLSAAQALLQTKSSMTSMRGKTFAFRGVPLIPTYHPAALLRNPGLKREAWVDLQRVRDTLRQRSAS
jgi:uracil-DNA glycosylase